MRRRSLVAVSLLVSTLIVISSFTMFFAAGADSTFGYTSVGSYSDTLVPGWKDSCRYLASQSGTINSISMYVQTANAQVRFGIYSDSYGKPSQLLAQSGQVTTGSYQWVTASLSAPVVAGQYYWLTVTTTATIKYNYDYASGGATCYTQSASTMSADYGSYTSWNAAKFSMYASFTVSSPTTTPTPSPTTTYTPAATTAPPASTGTFGYQQIGQNTIRLYPGSKDSFRCQAPQTGTLNSISLYVQTANAQVRLGIYNDVNGKPSELIAQTNLVNTAGYQWVTAPITGSIIAGQYYWLTITSPVAISYNFDYVSSAIAGHGSSSSTLSSSYGTYATTIAAKFSMYATYSTTNEPAPPSMPTPTPIPTQTPLPSSSSFSNNLAVIPSFWSYSSTHMMWSIGSPQTSGSLFYPVSKSGQTCIEFNRNPNYINYGGNRELNGDWVSIRPGDHVVYKAWFWTESSSIGDTSKMSGAAIGIDLYAQGRICEINTPNGVPTYPSYPATRTQCHVPWGSGTWVQLTIDFTVQGSYRADPWGGYYADGQYITPTGIIPWISAGSVNAPAEYAKIWIFGTELYINP